MNARVQNLTLALLATVAVLAAAQARGQTSYWQHSPSSASDWLTGGNWNGGLPTSSSVAYITNGGTANITTTGDICNTLQLGSGTGGTISMTGGGLATTWGYVGISGIGSFMQSGGTNSVYTLDLGYYSGDKGSYSLSGGDLSASYENAGFQGSGNFTQTGGTNSLSVQLVVGNTNTSSGTYSQQGGSLSAPTEYIAASGTASFVQYGGSTNSLTGNLYVGYNAGSRRDL